MLRESGLSVSGKAFAALSCFTWMAADAFKDRLLHQKCYPYSGIACIIGTRLDGVGDHKSQIA